MDKFNPFGEIDKEYYEPPSTPEELAKAKLEAGVVLEPEFLERMAMSDDPEIRQMVPKRRKSIKMVEVPISEAEKQPIVSKEKESSFRDSLIAEYRQADEKRKYEIRELVWFGKFPKEIAVDNSQYAVQSFGGIGFLYRPKDGMFKILPHEIFGEIAPILQDERDLSEDVLAFGVDNFKGKQFLLFRKLYKRNTRSFDRTYAFTLAFHPGVGIQKMAEDNPALVMQKIISDPILKDILLEDITSLDEKLFSNLLDWIGQGDWTLPEAAPDEEVRQLMLHASESPNFMGVKKEPVNLPSLESVAVTMAKLPEAVRKNLTWMIGGGSKYYPAGDNNLVISPRVTPGSDSIQKGSSSSSSNSRPVNTSNNPW